MCNSAERTEKIMHCIVLCCKEKEAELIRPDSHACCYSLWQICLRCNRSHCMMRLNEQICIKITIPGSRGWKDVGYIFVQLTYWCHCSSWQNASGCASYSTSSLHRQLARLQWFIVSKGTSQRRIGSWSAQNHRSIAVSSRALLPFQIGLFIPIHFEERKWQYYFN